MIKINPIFISVTSVSDKNFKNIYKLGILHWTCLAEENFFTSFLKIGDICTYMLINI